jgi:uncharacterized membrane protein YfcA
MVKAFLWWAGQGLVILLSVISIFIGWRVISVHTRDSINFILSLILLVVGVLLLIHFVHSIGERIRHEERPD